MTSDYNFQPRPQADREYASFRAGSDRHHTRVAVELEGGEAEEIRSTEEQLLLELRAIRIGINMLVGLNFDLLEMAIQET